MVVGVWDVNRCWLALSVRRDPPESSGFLDSTTLPTPPPLQFRGGAINTWHGPQLAPFFPAWVSGGLLPTAIHLGLCGAKDARGQGPGPIPAGARALIPGAGARALQASVPPLPLGRPGRHSAASVLAQGWVGGGRARCVARTVESVLACCGRTGTVRADRQRTLLNTST
jgi:hypothetical protein